MERRRVRFVRIRLNCTRRDQRPAHFRALQELEQRPGRFRMWRSPDDRDGVGNGQHFRERRAGGNFPPVPTGEFDVVGIGQAHAGFAAGDALHDLRIAVFDERLVRRQPPAPGRPVGFPPMVAQHQQVGGGRAEERKGEGNLPAPLGIRQPDQAADRWCRSRDRSRGRGREARTTC